MFIVFSWGRKKTQHLPCTHHILATRLHCSGADDSAKSRMIWQVYGARTGSNGVVKHGSKEQKNKNTTTPKVYTRAYYLSIAAVRTMVVMQG